MTAAHPIRFQNFVSGGFRAASTDHFFSDINPSDSTDVLGHVPDSLDEEIDVAVSAASEALPAWNTRTGAQRAQHLYSWARSVEAGKEELAQAICREVGKPITEARGEVSRCVAILQYFAGEAVRSIGDVIPAQSAGALQFTRAEPLGVIALITPWNFPLAIPVWKAAPALAFGNCVVWKPSEHSSYVSTLLAETAAAANLPRGVFNLVHGTGRVGASLLDRESVAAVSFTGSSFAGAIVARTAAARNIRFQTEMGGKNVAIVARDADLDLAADLIASGAMRYAGQKCTATSRVVVAREVEDSFLAKLKARIEALPIGPVTDPQAAIGPVISEQSLARLRDQLNGTDAERVIEVPVPQDACFERGFFFPPTVLRGVSPDSPLAQNELFGPILVSFVAEDLDHAIRLANQAPFGLSASLYTRDLPSALTYVDRLHAGMVRVNGDTTGVDPHAPFGGMKASSSGSREQGRAAFHFYTQTKTVEIRPS